MKTALAPFLLHEFAVPLPRVDQLLLPAEVNAAVKVANAMEDKIRQALSATHPHRCQVWTAEGDVDALETHCTQYFLIRSRWLVWGILLKDAYR